MADFVSGTSGTVLSSAVLFVLLVLPPAAVHDCAPGAAAGHSSFDQ